MLTLSGVLAQGFGQLIAPGEEEPEGTEDEKLPQRTEIMDIIPLERAIDPDEYILGPGDEIGLDVLTSEVFTYDLRITPTGDLFIPAAGACNLAGLSITAAKDKVESFVREQAFPSAKARIALLNPREFKLQIVGAVNMPGFVTVSPVTRLDQIITLAEGFHQFAMEHAIKIERETGVIETINYTDYLLNGSLESNPTFIEGDRIIVPFGKIEESGIVVRGSIEGAGYDIISPNETLQNYILRQVIFRKDTDLQNVTIAREKNGKQIFLVVDPASYGSTILKPGDVLNFLWERGVMVTGFVQEPGGFMYFPGYSVTDYIALAGGNEPEGNPNAATIRHLDGSSDRGLDTEILRGDVIYVPRTFKDIFIGDMSLLAVTTGILTIYLTYLRTVN